MRNPSDISILVGCEESQAVTIAFRERGFQAFSCDILPESGGHPDWHYQQDIFEVMKMRHWDCIISFPPCTDLALSGAAWFEKKRADGRQEESIKFFFEVWKNSNATENPMGIFNGGKYIAKWFPSLYRDMARQGFPFKPSQVIQPYYFGDEFQKTTCLWLKGLPRLYHNADSNLFDSVITHVNKGEFIEFASGKRMQKWYALLRRDSDRGHIRSKTFPGISVAMATQWGDFLLHQK